MHLLRDIPALHKKSNRELHKCITNWPTRGTENNEASLPSRCVRKRVVKGRGNGSIDSYIAVS